MFSDAHAGVARPGARDRHAQRHRGERRRRPAPPAGGSLSRRRRAGAATPAATRAQAAARMPLDARKGGEYMVPAGRAQLPGARPPAAADQGGASLDRIAAPCDPTPPTPRAAAARTRLLPRSAGDLRSWLAAARAERAGELHHARSRAARRTPIRSTRCTRSSCTSRPSCSWSSRARWSTRCTSSAPRRARSAAQIHGNTRLEIGWTVGRGADPRGAHRGHVRQAAEHHQPAELDARPFLGPPA